MTELTMESGLRVIFPVLSAAGNVDALLLTTITTEWTSLPAHIAVLTGSPTIMRLCQVRYATNRHQSVAFISFSN